MICIRKDNCELTIERGIYEIGIVKFRKLLKIARSPENNYKEICMDITNMFNEEIERYTYEMQREDNFRLDRPYIIRQIKKINKMKDIIYQSLKEKYKNDS